MNVFFLLFSFLFALFFFTNFIKLPVCNTSRLPSQDCGLSNWLLCSGFIVSLLLTVCWGSNSGLPESIHNT